MGGKGGKGGKGSKGSKGGKGGGKGFIMCSNCQDCVRFSLFPSVLCVAVWQEYYDPQSDVASPVAQRLVAALRSCATVALFLNCTAGLHRRGPRLRARGA